MSSHTNTYTHTPWTLWLCGGKLNLSLIAEDCRVFTHTLTLTHTEFVSVQSGKAFGNIERKYVSSK